MTQTQIILFTIGMIAFIWLLHGYLSVRLLQMFSIRARIGLLLSLLLTLAVLALAYLSRVMELTELAWLSRFIFYEIGWLVLTLPWLLLLDTLLLLSRLGQQKFTFCRGRYNPWSCYQVYKKQLAIGFLLASFTLTGVAWLQFQRDILINHITLSSPKVSETYQLLHISDVQLGSVSPAHVEKIGHAMQDAIDTYNIDLILNTGDQVDSASYTSAQLAPIAYTSPPTFFSLGNHEFYHDEQRILDILQAQQQIILRGQNARYKELNIIGIDDTRDPQVVTSQLQQQQLIQTEQFNILMFHRPIGVVEAKQHGIDLMLSGHTHGGQIFPITLMVKWLNDYPQGLTLLDNFALYTTDGAGLWGPNLRLGTRNEIAVITIQPEVQR